MRPAFSAASGRVRREIRRVAGCALLLKEETTGRRVRASGPERVAYRRAFAPRFRDPRPRERKSAAQSRPPRAKMAAEAGNGPTPFETCEFVRGPRETEPPENPKCAPA